ncbi:MAG: D-2-hydroxyacid dehydrogenase [Chloroflexota bacterium]
MKLVMATRMGAPYLSLLDDVKDVDIVWADSPQELSREIVDADAVFGWPNQEQIKSAKKLRWVQTPSAGVEMLCNIPEFIQSDIDLTNGRGAHARAIAEHAFALLLGLTRLIVPFTADKTVRRWRRDEIWESVLEIAGWKMGIVGYGNIGQQTAKRALAFEMDVRAVDVETIEGAPHGIKAEPISHLDDLMAWSDVVVVAAPYTRRTHQMIGAKQINAMKKGSFLVVVSRGGIIDENALLDALKSEHLAGAGLDVFAIEPYPQESPLWNAPNLIMTPHVAGASTQMQRRCIEILRENIGRFQRGETLMNLCDKEKGY